MFREVLELEAVLAASHSHFTGVGPLSHSVEQVAGATATEEAMDTK